MTSDFTEAEKEALSAQLMRARRQYREHVLHPLLREAVHRQFGVRLSMVGVALLAGQLEREGSPIFDNENEAVLRIVRAENGIEPS